MAGDVVQPCALGIACDGREAGPSTQTCRPARSLLVPCPSPPRQAISGDKLPDKSQGLLSGMLKDMGYTESMVYKF